MMPTSSGQFFLCSVQKNPNLTLCLFSRLPAKLFSMFRSSVGETWTRSNKN